MIRREFSKVPSLSVTSGDDAHRGDIHAYIHGIPDEFKAAAPMTQPYHHPRRLQQAASCADHLVFLTAVHRTGARPKDVAEAATGTVAYVATKTSSPAPQLSCMPHTPA